MDHTSAKDLAPYVWPLNPTDHFINITGQINSRHVSRSAAVYFQGFIPTPWLVLFLSWLVSSIIILIAFISNLLNKDDDEDADTTDRTTWHDLGLFGACLKRPSKWRFFRAETEVAKDENLESGDSAASQAMSIFDHIASITRHCRKPGIIYNAYRVVILSVQCFQVPTTRIIPSSGATLAIAFSLLAHTLHRDRHRDVYTYVVLICSAASWCLMCHQVLIALKLTDNVVAPLHGSWHLVGGNCPRLLRPEESCSALLQRGCETASQTAGGIISNLVSADSYELMAGFHGIVAIPFIWITRCKQVFSAHKKLDVGSSMIISMLTLFVMLMLMPYTMFAKPAVISYVDALLPGGAAYNSSSVWTDCFSIDQPSAGDGFIEAWYEQQWNSTFAAKAALFAVI